MLAWLSLSLPSASAAESLLLSGATVHTVAGDVLPSAQVLIRDGRIAAVSASANLSADRTEDLSGLHLFPGLIDASSTLGLNEISAVRATVDDREVGAFTPEVVSWVSVNPDSELIPVARANGITHVNVVPEGGTVTGQSSVIQLAGWTIEDMAVERQTALHVNWPGMGLNTNPDNKTSLKDQDLNRRKAITRIDEFFNQAQAYARARSAGNAETQRVPAWEAMLPYLDGSRPLFIHADEYRQIQSILDWIQNRRYRAVLVGGRDAWQLADALSAAKVGVVYHHVFELPPDQEDGFDVQYRAASVLRKAGVPLAISIAPGGFEGSDARNLPYEAAQAMAYGLPGDEALKSITLYPAQLLGLGDRLGSIEAGKDATLIAVTGDILDIRSQVKRMWIAGREVGLESRHTRRYEKYRNRP